MGRITRLLITAVLTLVTVGHVFYAAWGFSATYDERPHYFWSKRLVETGETERTSWNRLKSTTPILTLNVLLEPVVETLFPTEIYGEWFARRLPHAVWLLGLYLLVYLVGRQIAGERAGVIALLLTALDINLIAHSSILTVDAPFACVTLLVVALAMRYTAQPKRINALLLGAALGLALVTKYSALLLLLCVALFPFAAWPAARRFSKQPLESFNDIAAAAIICGVVISLFYRFSGIGVPLGEISFRQPFFKTIAGLLPILPIPLPADFLLGIDRCLDAERGTWQVILFNTHHPTGVWYYFFAIWFFKTPVFLIAATLVGFANVIRARTIFSNPHIRCLCLTLVVLLGYFSFLFRTQVGYRYVLMCLPIVYLIASVGLASFSYSRAGRIFMSFGVLLTLGGHLWYWGNSISFTNVLIQPKHSVYKLMADSNIDFGQIRDRRNEFMTRNGIEIGRIDLQHILPGTNVFSVNSLAGVFHNFDQHRWVRENVKPTAHYGHTYIEFQIDEGTFDRFLLEDRMLEPLSNVSSFCLTEEPEPRLEDGEFIDILNRDYRDFCLRASETTRIRFTAPERSTSIGLLAESGWCRVRRLGRGQELWYNITPGIHRFCRNRHEGLLRLEVVSGALTVGMLSPRCTFVNKKKARCEFE